ncbi:MAG: DUF177 domain-containing protein [Pseudomonadota bacterium]|jgi:uncharacterized metal-binding protein YceD (DUF177 family)|nr:DUF177 domain-containing protein [Pseudomonadota bacterium]MEC7703331.1 DUF177 domain-containing protein [Pseudomonadota bacterium]MEC9234812.1 DUF177 domain-containing protein [Pseudomonadota bacterium]
MSDKQIESPKWNVFYRVDKLKKQRDRLKAEAFPEDLADIAEFLKVEAISNLKANITINRPDNNHLIYVSGTVSADIEQQCVRTLRPVYAHIEEPFDAYFSETDKAISFAKGKSDLLVRHGHDEVPMLDEKDDPEPVVDGVINLGDLALQFLALAIPLYPKAEGIDNDDEAAIFAFDDEVDVKEKDNSSEKYSPFAELANWRDKVNLQENSQENDGNDEKDKK